MADQILTTGKLKALKYLPAMLPEAVNLATIASSATPAQMWLYGNISTQQSNRVVTLRSLQAPSTTDVSLIVTSDQFSAQSVDSVAAALLAPQDPTHGPLWETVAADRILVQAQNQSGATVDNFWANASVLVERPSIAQLDKIGVPLTGAQQALADKYAFGSRGVLPRRFEWVRDNEYKTQIVDAAVYSATLDVAAGATPIFFTATVGADEMLVMAALAVTPGSGSDGLTTLIQVDDEQSFLPVPNFPAGSGKPLALFVQAGQQIIVTATATTTVNNVSIAANIWRVRLTPEIRFRMGDAAAATQTVAEKITAGVL